MNQTEFEKRLAETETLHRHLCPRQVLGVRMGIFAGELLGLELPQPFKSKRLLAIAETDGCFVDGISVAANCWVGRRTLRIVDYGKVAATFLDCQTGTAIRLSPKSSARTAASNYAPEGKNRWSKMLLGYQRIPAINLFQIEEVHLTQSIENLISRPGTRVDCTQCGEEIINERELWKNEQPFCYSCFHTGYYTVAKAQALLLNR